MIHPVIIAARRTPIGRVGRSLKTLPVEALMAPVIQALLEDTGISPLDIDEVILGNAVGPGGNPARLAVLAAGLPIQVSGVTVDRQCGSGLEAINWGARLIQSGAAEVVIAGGMESVSTAPWRIEKPQSLYELPQFAHRARFAPEALGDPDMGVAAEQVAQKFGIGRDRQDQYALQSHQRAIASLQSGRFQAEIVPVSLSSMTQVDTDECPRNNITLERLAKLPSAFMENGTVTIGNACPVNDGAAAVLMVSDRKFNTLGCIQGLRFVDATAVGVDPNLLGIGSVAAVQKLLQRQAIALVAIDLVEFNEAFAAQVLACLDALNLDQARVNVGGGAIALGHPYGASGAILVTRLFTEMIRRAEPNGKNPRLGLATLGIGGGLGVASLFAVHSSASTGAFP
ncbi:MAG: thiolase family protein [Oculatellaceae cyanobacterium Prado106]|nr:thiolase family protein [Oculatellaceae cyanobacterium Prado106]